MSEKLQAIFTLCLQGQKRPFIEHMLNVSDIFFVIFFLQTFPGYRSHFSQTMAGHIVIIETLHCQTVCEQQQKNQ